ncbi:hypothetical protein GGQ84_002289 [Desulfitispora alkaliphila]|uniref:hypothetical protein n=1 Tax=Desulfitispora alkaliphila TaxID=622674 RepID=UPI003D2488B4
MIGNLFRKLNFWKLLNNNSEDTEVPSHMAEQKKVSGNINTNRSFMKTIFSDNYDVVIRDFVIGEDQKVSAFIVFVDGLVQENLINDNSTFSD